MLSRDILDAIVAATKRIAAAANWDQFRKSVLNTLRDSNLSSYPPLSGVNIETVDNGYSALATRWHSPEISNPELEAAVNAQIEGLCTLFGLQKPTKFSPDDLVLFKASIFLCDSSGDLWSRDRKGYGWFFFDESVWDWSPADPRANLFE